MGLAGYWPCTRRLDGGDDDACRSTRRSADQTTGLPGGADYGLGYVARKDLTGQRFGRLVVMERLSVGRWTCKCACGQQRDVDARYLYDGRAFDCQSMKNGNKCSLRREVA